MWTIIPTDEVLEEMANFSRGAQVLSVEERKKMYDKVCRNLHHFTCKRISLLSV
jgi:hypothetical protein